MKEFNYTQYLAEGWMFKEADETSLRDELVQTFAKALPYIKKEECAIHTEIGGKFYYILPWKESEDEDLYILVKWEDNNAPDNTYGAGWNWATDSWDCTPESLANKVLEKMNMDLNTGVEE